MKKKKLRILELINTIAKIKTSQQKDTESKKEILNWKVSQKNHIQKKAQINIRIKNIEDRFRHMDDIKKKFNLHLIGILEGKKRDKWSKSNI